MGFIKTLFSLAILLIILIAGYWLYATKASAPDAPYWAEINSNLPDPLRSWSCGEVRARLKAENAPAGPTPLGCEGSWQ